MTDQAPWTYRIHTECRDCGDTFIAAHMAPNAVACRGCGRTGEVGKEQLESTATPEWNRTVYGVAS